MALHLNLHHEIERDRLAKARDPLKLSMFGLGVVAAIFAGYYFWQVGIQSGISHELGGKQAEFSRLEPKAKEAQVRIEELSKILETSNILVESIEKRFYWAPILEHVAKIVPREVQITKLAGDLQGTTYKKCVLTLDGVSSGTVPRKTAENLRSALAEGFEKQFKTVSSKFLTLEEGPDTVKVDGVAQPTALFRINFQLVITEAPPPVIPVVKKKKQ